MRHLRRRGAADASRRRATSPSRARPSTRSWCPAPRPRRRSRSCRRMRPRVCWCRAAAPVSYTASHDLERPVSSSTADRLPARIAVHRHRRHHDLRRRGPAQDRQRHVGTIDYANGILSLNPARCPNSKAITTRQPRDLQCAAKLGDRGHAGVAQPVHVGTVNLVPQPGTLSISYMAQGRWYVPLYRWRQRLAQRGWTPATARVLSTRTPAFVVTLGLPDVGADPDVERADAGNAAANRCPEGIAGPAARPARRPACSRERSRCWPHESGYAHGRKRRPATSGGWAGTATWNVAQNCVEFAPERPAAGRRAADRGLRAGPGQEDSFAHSPRDGQGGAGDATLGSIEPGSLRSSGTP